jgi:hypothetical protein
MSKRFGKTRVPDCCCEHNFTCGPCLRAAPPPIFTPGSDVRAGDQYDSGRKRKAKTKACRICKFHGCHGGWSCPGAY